MTTPKQPLGKTELEKSNISGGAPAALSKKGAPSKQPKSRPGNTGYASYKKSALKRKGRK